LMKRTMGIATSGRRAIVGSKEAADDARKDQREPTAKRNSLSGFTLAMKAFWLS
jgi:hypothetical protein